MSLLELFVILILKSTIERKPVHTAKRRLYVLVGHLKQI